MGKSSSRSRSRKKKKRLVALSRKTYKRRRTKSKKHPRRHDSVSCSTGYDSSSSLRSSSDDAAQGYRRHKRHRSRSLSRNNARGSKKKDRKQRAYSSESTQELRAGASIKRKRSHKNKHDSGSREKSHNKRRKRRASITSTDTDSLSCSTCDAQGESSGESDFENRWGSSMTRRMEKHSRRAAERIASPERSRRESRSCSSSSNGGWSNHDLDEDRVVVVDNSKRLRSVITTYNKDDEIELESGQQKEEILHDNDDWPPSRSSDSNEIGNKRESAHQSYDEPVVTVDADNEEIVESAVFNTTSQVVKKSGEGWEQLDVINTVNAKNGLSGGGVNEDLESVLRQRALENLKRFRRIDKPDEGSDLRETSISLKQTPAVTTELAQGNFPRVETARSEHTAENQGCHGSIHEKISSAPNSSDSKGGDNKSEAAGPSSLRGSVLMPNAGSLGKNLNRFSSFPANKPRLTAYTWRRDSTNTKPALENLPHAHNPDSKMLEKQVAASKNVATSAEEGTTRAKFGDYEVNKQLSSAAPNTSMSSTSASLSSETNGADKVTDRPRYEQKTMSVTRGGETIEVNYQVYIPKRATTLARRQLKR